MSDGAAPPSLRRCDHCGGTTHDSLDCPVRRPRRCGVCRERGHDARNCGDPLPPTLKPRAAPRATAAAIVQGATEALRELAEPEPVPLHRARPGHRSRTESWLTMRRHLRVVANDVGDEYLPPRPRTRADCANVPRPCPYVGCRFNLFLDVNVGGGIQYSWVGLEPDQMLRSCALDVAEEGGLALEAVAAILGVTRERIRQIEVKALRKTKKVGQRVGI